MDGIEKEAIKSKRECPDCGLTLVSNKDIYPLDEAIGIQGDCVTIGVKERALWAAVEVSYEKTSEFLRKSNGLEVSRNKIHGMSLEEGKRIEAWEEDRRFKVFEEGEDIEDAEGFAEKFYLDCVRHGAVSTLLWHHFNFFTNSSAVTAGNVRS
jgi:hypothetical protein